jgi:hypothetical protein
LAAVARNALMNGDFPRVIAVLEMVVRLPVRRVLRESHQDEIPSETITN